MHAATCLPAITGAWGVRGGGGLYSYANGFHVDQSLVMASEHMDPSVRGLDMSRIGPILTGDRDALGDGPGGPCHAHTEHQPRGRRA